MYELPTDIVRPPKEGNPLYPLPPDYPKLSAEEQREARVNAVSLQETPEDLVYAWSFFRAWYLKQTPKGFFYKRWRESPRFHYEAVDDIGRYQWNAIAAPRASAKSTVLGVEVPMLLSLTRRYFNILLVFSKETLVTKRMTTQIGYQFLRNPYIVADFGADIKPLKGQGVWNAHLMQLSNGASIEACSVRGGMLGQRPDLILVDDPEVDPVMNKVTPELRENYERLLTNHIMPMLDDGGSALYWIGTLLSKQCFLYHVVTSRTDARFERWNRRLLDAEDDGYGNLLWKEKWDHDKLEQDKQTLGIAAYNAQRRNRPGSGEEQVLKLHDQLSSYIFEGELNHENPLASQGVLRSWVRRYTGPEGVPVTEMIERPFEEVVPSLYRVMAMDWARCLSPTSDYIAIPVIGIENTVTYRNVWWFLDLFVGRLQGEEWVRRFWDMALRWKVRYAGVEAVAAQQTLVNTARMYAEKAAALEGWAPRVVPITYPHGFSKEDRISTLEWRFAQYRMKLPVMLKNKWPWRELYHEIEGFSGLPGGTQFDDPLDATAMIQFMLKGGTRAVPVEDGLPSGRYDLGEELAKGNLEVAGGISAGLGLGINEVPHDVLMKLGEQHAEDLLTPNQRRFGLCITSTR